MGSIRKKISAGAPAAAAVAAAEGGGGGVRGVLEESAPASATGCADHSEAAPEAEWAAAARGAGACGV